jgi:queuine tRNA-ribosyltransferase
MLLTWHNIHYYQRLTREVREAIEEGRFAAFEANFHHLQSLDAADVEA